jgi:hypothetical protein
MRFGLPGLMQTWVHPEVLDVPVGLRLRLVPVVDAHRVYAEGEPLHDVADGVDRALLVAALADAPRPDARRVVDRREPVAPAPVGVLELQELTLTWTCAGDLLLWRTLTMERLRRLACRRETSTSGGVRRVAFTGKSSC